MSKVALRTAVLSLALIVGPIYAQTFALNESFNLNVGETRQLIDAEFSITFVGVEYDRRCPIGVGCLWQGNAAAQFAVKVDGSSQSITLRTIGSDPFPGTIEVYGRTVSLLNLGPYPRWQMQTAPDAFVATLFVS